MSPWLAVIAASLVGGTALYTTLRGFGWWWALPGRARIALAMLPVALLLAAGVARGADGGAPPERCPPSGDVFYLVGPIGSQIVPHLTGWLARAKEPVLLIDSPGGTMEASTQIYEAVKRHGRVRCRVLHLAASGAFAVLQACAVREMGRDSILATHEPRILWPQPLDRVGVRELALFLEAVSRTWNAMCRARLRISAETYDAYVKGKDWIMKAPEALAAGAIDRVL